MNINAMLRLAPVIPVVVIEDARHAVPLARALVAGGLPMIEITLRTAAGLEAIRAIAAEVPEAVVGAGTVLTPAQLDAVQAAGARFAVSPGATPRILEAAADRAIPLLPGIATATEAMLLIERGFTCAKFFPAAPAGGVAYLSALAAPLPQLKFCPTGGITLASAPEFLALGNVLCVGGSWMVGRAALEAQDWAGVTAAAAAAARLDAHSNAQRNAH
jgi:2-dehydro-3-deoxyphosphogluconate aldolase/(4S)-4-hydroxy-2-oxoglutarate aldolase